MADWLEVDGFLLAKRALALLGVLVELMVDEFTLVVDDSLQLVAVSQSRQQDGVFEFVLGERTLVDEFFPALLYLGQRDASVPVDLPVIVRAQVKDFLEMFSDASSGQVQLDVRVA